MKKSNQNECPTFIFLEFFYKGAYTVKKKEVPTIMIIAVDGPAGAGKGTIAGYLSVVFNLAHIDSGRIYRNAGLWAFEKGIDLDKLDDSSIQKIATFMETLTLDDLSNPSLRLEEVAAYASKIAVIPAIRNAANQWMHSFCNTLPTSFEGAIIDGRDIGTVVFPNADGKLFITASEEVRLKRRSFDTNESEARIAQLLRDRDVRDSTRKTAPLQSAEDAFTLDTSHLNIDEACRIASEYVVNSCIHGKK